MALLLVFYKENLKIDFDYSEIYPLLLARLDDSQDTVRIEAFQVFEIYFKCAKVFYVFTDLS